MRRLIILLLLLTPVSVLAQLSEEAVQARAAALYEAIQTRNAESLTPLLSDGCRVQDFDDDTGRRVLHAIVVQLAPIDSLRVVDICMTGQGADVRAEISKDGKTTPCSFSLNGEGLFTDISLVGSAKVVKTQAQALQLIPVCELPFECLKGFIVIDKGIEMEGKKGVFILDSGCKTTLFNSASPAVAAEVSETGVTQRSGVVSSGAQQIQVVQIDTLKLGDNRFSLCNPASDLTMLAQNIGLEELTGLLGYDLLRYFEIHIDYRKGVVRLYALDAEGNAVDAPQPQVRIGFELEGGYLPLFRVDAGRDTLRMLFDTGASACCLTPDAVIKLGSKFRPGREVQLRDADAAVGVKSGKITSLHWGGKKLHDVNAVVRDLSTVGDVDGILGYPVVAGKCISLNYVKCEFCFY